MPRRRKLPAELFSVLGPIPVEYCRDLVEDQESFGIYNMRPRSILLDEQSSDSTRLQTLWHEATHVALRDGGAHNSLTHEQEEAVCDAMGTYLAAMVQAGYLKFSTPRR